MCCRGSNGRRFRSRPQPKTAAAHRFLPRLLNADLYSGMLRLDYDTALRHSLFDPTCSAITLHPRRLYSHKHPWNDTLDSQLLAAERVTVSRSFTGANLPTHRARNARQTLQKVLRIERHTSRSVSTANSEGNP